MQMGASTEVASSIPVEDKHEEHKVSLPQKMTTQRLSSKKTTKKVEKLTMRKKR